MPEANTDSNQDIQNLETVINTPTTTLAGDTLTDNGNLAMFKDFQDACNVAFEANDYEAYMNALSNLNEIACEVDINKVIPESVWKQITKVSIQKAKEIATNIATNSLATAIDEGVDKGTIGETNSPDLPKPTTPNPPVTVDKKEIKEKPKNKLGGKMEKETNTKGIPTRRIRRGAVRPSAPARTRVQPTRPPVAPTATAGRGNVDVKALQAQISRLKAQQKRLALNDNILLRDREVNNRAEVQYALETHLGELYANKRCNKYQKDMILNAFKSAKTQGQIDQLMLAVKTLESNRPAISKPANQPFPSVMSVPVNASRLPLTGDLVKDIDVIKNASKKVIAEHLYATQGAVISDDEAAEIKDHMIQNRIVALKGGN